MFRIMAFIALTVSAYISFTYLALVLRVIMGMFSDGGGVFASFVFAVTEPILLPIRKKLDRIEAFQNLPMDISVLVAMIIFTLLTLFLPRAV